MDRRTNPGDVMVTVDSLRKAEGAYMPLLRVALVMTDDDEAMDSAQRIEPLLRKLVVKLGLEPLERGQSSVPVVFRLYGGDEAGTYDLLALLEGVLGPANAMLFESTEPSDAGR